MAARIAPLLIVLAAFVVVISADPAAIIAFNNEAQQAVRDYGIPSQISSRLYSAVHIAQHLAIQGNDATQHPAQAAYAGHTVLNLFFPYRFARLNRALAPFLESLSAAERGAAEKQGRKVGIDTFQLFSTDGFDKYAPFTPAPEGGPVGEYQFTPNQTNAVYPQIETTRTVVLKQPYEGAPPLTIPSPEYTRDLEEVFKIGGKNSSERTAYDDDTPNFWANGNTTSSTAGAWNKIAQSLLPNDTSTADAALLFAQLNAATWDASISTYRQKYLNPYWRPITAIRQGDGSQENAALVDPEWTPQISTPAHPEHPSGHAATSASAAAVLRKFLGTDDVSFTVESEFPGGLEPRSYTSLTQALDEGADARILGGVHFRHATDVGNDIGTRVGEYVYDNFASVFKRSGSSRRLL